MGMMGVGALVGLEIKGAGAARVGVSLDEVEHARRLRARGLGWQAVANMVGRNRDSLRRAVEDGETIRAPSVVAPREAGCGAVGPMRMIRLKPGTLVLEVLELLAGGGSRLIDLDFCAALGVSARQLRTALGVLRGRGWVEQLLSGRWRATDAGLAELDAARARNAAEAGRPGVVPVQPRIAAAMAAQGWAEMTARALAERAGLACSTVTGALARMEAQGLVRTSGSAPSGKNRARLWVATDKGRAAHAAWTDGLASALDEGAVG